MLLLLYLIFPLYYCYHCHYFCHYLTPSVSHDYPQCVKCGTQFQHQRLIDLRPARTWIAIEKGGEAVKNFGDSLINEVCVCSKHILTLCYGLWLNSSMIVVWWNSQRLVHHGLITLSISYLQLSTIILKYHIKFIILIRYRINIYIYIRYAAAIPLEFSQKTTIARPRVGARAPCTNPSGSWIPCRVWLPSETPWITVEADGNGAKSCGCVFSIHIYIDTLRLWLT